MLRTDDILQNRYRIIRKLGEGGMGAVYEAEDNQRFDKPVALKEVRVDLTNTHSEHFRRAFKREAKILTQIDHEAVPRVFGYFQETERQFLVMELIKGDDLDEILEKRQKPFPLENILNWANQLLDALDYLHTLSPPIIHRDIKPQNLKLNARGRIKLLDFGIAKDSEVEIGATKSTKTFVGATLYYSPIEQILRIPDFFQMLNMVDAEKAKSMALQSSDARSDIYSLGATLYHLLTNTLPKPAHIRAFEVWTGKEDSLMPLHKLNADIPPEISEVLHKAMEIERENRFATANQMRAALQDAIWRDARAKEEEDRRILLEAHERIRREREELEAERREIEAERRRFKEKETEAERKLSEKLEYEAKLKQWQSENPPEEKKTIGETLPAATQPSVENPPPVTNSFDYSETPEKKSFAETTSPSYRQGIVFKSENAKPLVTTIKNDKPNTAPDFSIPADSPKGKAWVLPVAVVVFLFFGITAFGLYMMSGDTDGTSNKIVSKPDTSLPTATPMPSPSAVSTVSQTPAQNVSNTEKPKQTPAPNTPKPQTSRPQTTTQKPKTQPSKNNDCIFTGDC